MTSDPRIPNGDTCRHGFWSSDCHRCADDAGLDDASPRITHIEHADPGDEQAERREFEAWAVLSDDGEEFFAAFRDNEEAHEFRHGNERLVHCTLILKESAR